MNNSSTELARSVVAALVEAGVTEIVLAPGSRNAPLAFAAYDADAAGLLRLHTRVDERSAGFLALGLTRVGARAAVVCTSGTAVANLHPAVLEAAHSGLPLVVVTADRPGRLRGTGANQTTDQVGIFGPLVTTLDVAGDASFGRGSAAATGLAVGQEPTHLNIQLDDPLVPGDAPGWALHPRRAEPAPRPSADPLDIEIGPRTVVVAGTGAGRAGQLAAAGRADQRIAHG